MSPKPPRQRRALAALLVLAAVLALFGGCELKHEIDAGWMDETTAYEVADAFIAETMADLPAGPGFEYRDRTSTVCNEDGFAPSNRASVLVEYVFNEVKSGDEAAFRQQTLKLIRQRWKDAGYSTVVDKPYAVTGFTFVVDADRGIQLSLESGARMTISAESGCARRTDKEPNVKPLGGAFEH